MKRPIYPRRKTNAPAMNYFEQALHHAQYALRQLVHAVPSAICVLDGSDFTYLEVNQSFCDLIGIPRSLVIDQRDGNLPAGLGENNLKKIAARMKEETALRNLELFIFTRDGKLVRSYASVERITYNGRAALMITLTRYHKEDTRSRPSQQESKLAAAGEVGRTLAEIYDLDEIYRRLSAAIYQMLPDVCTVYISLHDSERNVLNCVYGEHEGDRLNINQLPQLTQQEQPASHQFDVIRRGKPLVIDDLLAEAPPGTARLSFVRGARAVRSGVYVPMVARGRVIGLVQAHSYRPARFRVMTDTALLSLIANTAAIAIQNAQLAQSLEKSNMDLTQTYEATIDGWTRALELRDYTTERHTSRVVDLTLELAKKMGVERHNLVQVRRGAQLHDIGKIGIPDAILLKPAPLDETEWRIMRRHPLYAYELLRPIPHFNELIDIPYCHHEKWDGSGYPRRLRGEEIPMGARIFAVVDVWDALSSNRPYRAAWQPHQVVDYIRYQSNKHFQPEVAHAFLDLVGGASGGASAPRGAGFNPSRYYSTRL
ncbi:MAG: HD domain-containing phosphohydrolase [Chloroflexota bacterium]